MLQGLFIMLPFADVHAGSNVAKKISSCPEAWHSGVDKPSILPIRSLQPIFHCEGSACSEGSHVVIHAWLKVCRMYSFRPAVSDFLFYGPARKFQPLVIKERAKRVRAGNPDHDGS